MLTTAVFLSAMGLSSFFSQHELTRESENSVMRLLNSTVSRMNIFFGSVEKSLKVISWTVEERKTDVEYLKHITRMIVENDDIDGSTVAFVPYYFPNMEHCAPYSFVHQETGEIKSKMLGEEDVDYFKEDWFAKCTESGEALWSDPYFDQGGARFMMTTYSFPLKDNEGRTYAVLTADVPLENVMEMTESLRPYAESDVFIISDKGTVIAAGNKMDLVGQNILSLTEKTENDGLSAIYEDSTVGKPGIRKFRWNGVLRFAAYQELDNGWWVLFTFGYKDILTRVNILWAIVLAVGLIGILSLLLFNFRTISKMTAPLRSISAAAAEITAGNFHPVLPAIDTNDEIKQLRDSFLRMEESLDAQIERIEKETARNQRFESELRIASGIQASMAPTDFPVHGNVRLNAVLKPAKEVGGDLYDFYIKDNILYFAIGDVSGKGVPASLFMAITRAAFRFISQMGLEMNEVLQRINNAICEGNSGGMFVTMFIGRMNLETGELDYCNAGHNPLLLNGCFLDVKPNLALGVMVNFSYIAQRTVLRNGDSILAYTDGVTEAEKTDGEQYGEDRLKAFAISNRRLDGTGELCEKLLQEIHSFTEGNEQNDDITIMTIKYIQNGSHDNE